MPVHDLSTTNKAELRKCPKQKRKRPVRGRDFDAWMWRCDDGTVKVYLPIRTYSESNMRGHWAKKAARVKRQREVAFLYTGRHRAEYPKSLATTLTRIAPRMLDDDNLAASMKAIQDGVADALGIDDRHISWTYKQRKGKPREYAVEVEVKTCQPNGGNE